MNDAYEVSSGRGVPHAEASATTESVSNSTSGAPEQQTRAEEDQVPRSPQPLSLQIDGLNATVYEKNHPNIAYFESSERGSDSSVDGRRPEIQSASTFTDSQNSVPSSSVNDSGSSMELRNSRSFEDNTVSTKTYRKWPATQDKFPLNGNGSIDGSNFDIKMEEPGNGLYSPVRSPKHSSSGSGNGMKFAPGHKRTATGDIKSVSSGSVAPQHSNTNGAARRRSKSTGSPAHGSRIAQLSVHIRTRLSYAAAKIEKSRQSRSADPQFALRGLASLSELSSPAPSSLHSVPSSSPTSHPQRASPIDTPRTSSVHHRSQSTISSPGKLLPFPKLAPPVDIISSTGDTRRRRPNPNTAAAPFVRSPYARHRRYHSHQENSVGRALNGSPPVLGPGTPSVPPTGHMHPSGQNGFHRPRTHSQNTAMEQDAIETLLFMSSPENSGYRSSPRPLQPPATQHSLNASLYSNTNGITTDPTQSSQGESLHNGRTLPLRTAGLGLEAHAGDEIDRILDQMESDSEDEARFASHRHGARAHATSGR